MAKGSASHEAPRICAPPGPARWWLVSPVILTVAFSCYWPLRARYLYEQDSIYLAGAAERLDLAIGHPYNLGCPLWTLATAGLLRWTGDAGAAMVLLSIAFTAAAAVFVYDLARRLQGAAAAATVAALFLFTPNVILYSTVATTYTVDLFTSALTGWFAARLWEGQGRRSAWGSALLGLLGGVRLAGVVFMAPLWIHALARTGRANWRFWLGHAAAFLGGSLVWLVPAVVMTGGVSKSLAAIFQAAAWLLRFLAASSVFHSRLAEVAGNSVLWAGLWMGIALAVPLLLAAVLWLARRVAGRGGAPLPYPSWHCPRFYATWLLPQLLLVLAIYYVRPCHQNLCLPPLVLLLGNVLCANARALARNGARACTVLAGLVVVASATWAWTSGPWLSAVLPAPFGPRARLASLCSPRETDQAKAELIKLVRAAEDSVYDPLAPPLLLCSIELSHAKPGWDMAAYYLPECSVGELSAGGCEETLRGRLRDWRFIPPYVHKIWWILPAGVSLEESLTGLAARRVAENRLVVLYFSEIGLAPLDGRFCRGSETCPVRRDVAIACRSGCGNLQRTPDGQYAVWLTGPVVQFELGLARAMRVDLLLDILESPCPDRQLRVACNGHPNGTFSAAAGGQIRVPIDGRQGVNTLELAFAMRGEPSARLVPGGLPDAALRVRQIGLRWNGGCADLLPNP